MDRFKRFARGLVVGKFSPLHKGHELLIGQAQAACDRVTIISYTKPGFPRCGRAAREAWLAERFPAAEVLVVDDASLAGLCRRQGLAPRTLPHDTDADAVHRDFTGWLCQDVLGHTVDAVFTSEDYGDGFAQALAARFGKPVAHVCVDKARRAVPVSGTAVRADPHRYRDFLAPAVYAGLVRRVAILGGESSGKTTLAQALAARLGSVWVPEYGRELWESRGGDLRYEDMLRIGRTQAARERRSLEGAAGWLLCDTAPLTTLFYSLEMFGRAEPGLHALARQPYDLLLLCAPDFAFVQDGTRRDAGFRARQHAWYTAELEARGMPHAVVTGGIEERVAAALALLQGLEKTAARSEIRPGREALHHETET